MRARAGVRASVMGGIRVRGVRAKFKVRVTTWATLLDRFAALRQITSYPREDSG